MENPVRRFAEITKASGAQALFNTHVFADGGLERLKLARERAAGAPNPFLIDPAAIGRYYGLLDECLLAAIARPHSAADGDKPTVPSH